MFSEEELRSYVRYWDADLEMLKLSHMLRKDIRRVVPLLSYLLHHPEYYEQLPLFWKRSIKEAITLVWDTSRIPPRDVPGHFRTFEVRKYFEELLNLWVAAYGKKAIFQMRYQNWHIIPSDLLFDQLWTVLC